MSQQIINVGEAANDGTGEPLRSAFTAVNNNFDQVWAAGPVGSQIVISNNVISTTETNLDLVLHANGIGNITVYNSIVPWTDSVYDLGSADNQFDTVWARYYRGNAALMSGLPEVPNLSAITTDLIPNANLAYDIGSGTQRWDTVYAGNGDFSSNVIVRGNLTVMGNVIEMGNAVTDSLTLHLANSAANVAEANGAGIVVGADSNIATILYDATSNIWQSNLGVSVGNIIIQGDDIFDLAGLAITNGDLTHGTTSGLNIVSNGSDNTTVLYNTYGNIAIFASSTGANVYTFNFNKDGNASMPGNVSVAANVRANYFIGNGSLLTGLPAGYANSNVVAYGETGWSGNILPSGNAVYSLGSSTQQWSDLYVSNATIYMNNIPLSMTSGNVLTINGEPILSNDSNTAITTSGNITANYFIGDGSQLTGISTASTGNLNLSGTTIAISAGATETQIDISPNGQGWTYLQLPNDATANIANVRLHNDAGNIQLSTGDFSTGSNVYNWYFANNGQLITPDGTIIGAVEGANTFGFYNSNANTEFLLEAGSTVWSFNGATGSIKFPTLTVDLHNGGNQLAQTLQFGDASQQVVITGPTPDVDNNAQRLIIQGQRGNGVGEGGDVYVWAGDADTNGGDIKIYAGDADNASSGAGGYVNLDGGTGFDGGGSIGITGGYSPGGYGGSVNLTAGNGNGAGVVNISGGQSGGAGQDGGYVNIQGGYGQNNGGAVTIQGGLSALGLANYGNVNINAGASSWVFDNTGNLALPGELLAHRIITFTDGESISADHDLLIISGGANGVARIDLNTGVNSVSILAGANSWSFNESGDVILPGGTGYINSAANTITMYSDAGETNGMLFYDGGAEVYASGDFAIFSDNANNGNIWRFYANATLQVPGNIDAALASPAPTLNGFAFNGSNITTSGNITLSGGDINNVGAVYAGGNVEANYFIGNGSQLTGLPAGYSNTDVATFLASYGSNTISTTGNITGGNILTTGRVGAGTATPAFNLDAVDNVAGLGRFSFTNPNAGMTQTDVRVGAGTNSNDVFIGIQNGNTFIDDRSANGLISIQRSGIEKVSINSNGNISAVGNISGSYILGNGSQLTGLPASYTDSNVTTLLASFGSNTITTTGNVSVGNITAANLGNISSLNLNGNASQVLYGNGVFAAVAGSSYSDSNVATFLAAYGSNTISTTGNITAGNLIGNISITGNVTGTSPNVTLVAGSYSYTFDNTGVLTLPAPSAGNEGAEIQFTQAANSTLSGNTVNIDQYVDLIRFFESGGTNRGLVIDIANAPAVTNAVAIGYRDVPQITLSANVTANSTNAGQHFYSTTAGNLQVTIPDNANVAFPTGATLTIVMNAAGNVIVAQGTGVSLYMAGSSTTGNRTVGAYGLASVMKVATNTWVISGTGVY